MKDKKEIKELKSVIKNTKFQTLENPKLTEQEILNLEKFREKFECTLKKGSQKKFEKLLITQPLMLELIQTKMKDETMKNRFTNIINNKWTEFSKEFIDESKKSFSELIENGERLGIKWKKIKTIEFDYKLNSSLPGISSAEFIYKFSFKDKKYEISINSLESLEKGFYISKMNSSYISEI